MHSSVNNFGKRLRSARKTAGLTRLELAGALGLHQEAIRNIEEGGVERINSEMLIAMAEVLKVNVDYFYRRPAPENVVQHIDFGESSKMKRQAVDLFERTLEIEDILGIHRTDDQRMNLYRSILKDCLSCPEKNASIDRLERLVDHALSSGLITSSNSAGLLNVSMWDVGCE